MLAMYPYCNQGGVTSVMKQRMPALCADGWEIDFVFRQDMGGKHELLGAGVRHLQILDKTFMTDIIRMVNSESYDCAVVFDVPELIHPLKRSFGGSLVYEIHTPILKNMMKNSADVLLASDAVFVPSRWSKYWLLHRFPELHDDRITVMPNIVDQTVFNPDGPRRDGIEKTLLWVGKLGEYKNWEEAVRIGLAFLRKHSEWQFLMVTGGSYTEKVVKDLLRYISKEDVSKRISWIHNLQLAEMGILYRSVASGGGILLSTSLAESFCLVIHEAMRCGLPVVSSNVGAVLDIVVDNHTGLLYNAGDIRKAQKNLDSLLNDKPLRNILVSNAFAELQKLSEERLCAQYLATLNRIACPSSEESGLWNQIVRLYDIDDMTGKLLADSIVATLNRKASHEEKVWIDKIESLRSRLNTSSQQVTYIDYGAGSPELNLTSQQMYEGKIKSSTIGKICRTASKQPAWCFLLFSLVRNFQPVTCLELGTCLGISTAYLAAGLELNRSGMVTTLEGAGVLASEARRNLCELGLAKVDLITGRFQDKLPEVLRAQKHFDFVYIDGHHDEQATLSYFEQILPFLNNNALIVFDDISWSEGMRKAWDTILSCEKVRLSVVFYGVGICTIAK